MLLAISVCQYAQAQDGYVGEIRLFAGNYAPVGWAFCDGKILPVTEYQALFTLLGKKYGGDGNVTFALPDLRGRVPMAVTPGEVGTVSSPPSIPVNYSNNGTVIAQTLPPPSLGLHYIICIQGIFPTRN